MGDFFCLADWMKVTLPSIHLNGTGKDMLLRGYKDAVKALREAQDAVGTIEFNARDYYVRDGAWEHARKEFNDAIIKLSEVFDYFVEVRNGISAGGHKWEDDDENA